MTGRRRNSKMRGCWLGTKHKVTSWPRPAGQDCPPSTRAHWEDGHSAGGDRRNLPHCPETNPLSTWENFLFCESSEERIHPIHTTDVGEPYHPGLWLKHLVLPASWPTRADLVPACFPSLLFQLPNERQAPESVSVLYTQRIPYLAPKSVMPFTPSSDHFPTQKLQIHLATLSRDALYPTPKSRTTSPSLNVLGGWIHYLPDSLSDLEELWFGISSHLQQNTIWLLETSTH